MNRRQQVRDKALEMFNERGVEYVGLREIAAALNMRVSNITYYFPTKDDLVFALAQELSAANSTILTSGTSLTVADFLQGLKAAFENQLTYRGLVVSVVHLLRQNRYMAATYEKTQRNRMETLTRNLQALMSNSELEALDEQSVQHLVYTISLISRFWIAEATVAFKKQSMQAHATYALKTIANLLLPYATAKGQPALQQFL